MFKVKIILNFPSLGKFLEGEGLYPRIPVLGDEVCIKAGSITTCPPVEKVLLYDNPWSDGPVAEIKVSVEGSLDLVFYEDLVSTGLWMR